MVAVSFCPGEEANMSIEMNRMIEDRFKYDLPIAAHKQCHEDVSLLFKKFTVNLVMLLPDCREHSESLAALDEACFWAHAAVAKHGEN
jgi:hypothetical protein